MDSLEISEYTCHKWPLICSHIYTGRLVLSYLWNGKQICCHSPDRNLAKKKKPTHKSDIKYRKRLSFLMLVPFTSFYLRNHKTGKLLLTNTGRKFHKENTWSKLWVLVLFWPPYILKMVRTKQLLLSYGNSS